jgi:DNA-binding CsgD family transcriptional regulator
MNLQRSTVHKLWLNLNRMAVEIHRVGTRKELVDLVTGSLPAALCAEEAWWSDHGPEKPTAWDRPSISFLDEVLARVRARTAPNQEDPLVIDSRRNRFSDANHDVFDPGSLHSKGRRHRSNFGKGDPRSGAGYHLVTQFFIDDQHGVLLTVRNSRPFTEEQKYVLGLLSEHLAIAARRQHCSDSEPMSPHSVVEDSDLSQREKEVLPCLVQGMTNPQIARTLGISARTVEKHVASILDKSGLDNRRMLIGISLTSRAKKVTQKNG